MWVSSLDTRGVAGCDAGPIALERIDSLTPAAQDALLLFAMAAQPSLRGAGAQRLGWSPRIDEEFFVDAPSAVRRMADEPEQRSFLITATLVPDPPLFGRLRNAVLRDPARALGLGDGTLTARFGWLFTADHTVVRPELLGGSLGAVELPLLESAWFPALLADIAPRIHLVDWRAPLQPLLDALAAGTWSPDPTLRARAHAVFEDLASGFGLDVHLVQTDQIELAVGSQLRPLRWQDPETELTLRTVIAARLFAPDVLLLPWRPTEALQSWLEQRTTGDDAVLEQVLVAP